MYIEMICLNSPPMSTISLKKRSNKGKHRFRSSVDLRTTFRCTASSLAGGLSRIAFYTPMK